MNAALRKASNKKMANDLQIAIDAAVIKAIQGWVDDVFVISQATDLCYCPVDTGNLKRSGSVSDLPNGKMLSYTADYAADVEFGKPGGKPFGKIIPFRPKISKFVRGPRIYRYFEKEPAQKGQFFITRAFQDGAGRFVKHLENNLKPLEKRKFI